MTIADWLVIGATITGPILAVQAQKWIERYRELKDKNRELLRGGIGPQAGNQKLVAIKQRKAKKVKTRTRFVKAVDLRSGHRGYRASTPLSLTFNACSFGLFPPL